MLGRLPIRWLAGRFFSLVCGVPVSRSSWRACCGVRRSRRRGRRGRLGRRRGRRRRSASRWRCRRRCRCTIVLVASALQVAVARRRHAGTPSLGVDHASVVREVQPRPVDAVGSAGRCPGADDDGVRVPGRPPERVAPAGGKPGPGCRRPGRRGSPAVARGLDDQDAMRDGVPDRLEDVLAPLHGDEAGGIPRDGSNVKFTVGPGWCASTTMMSPRPSRSVATRMAAATPWTRASTPRT